jgi:hypothetical protein
MYSCRNVERIIAYALPDCVPGPRAVLACACERCGGRIYAQEEHETTLPCRPSHNHEPHAIPPVGGRVGLCRAANRYQAVLYIHRQSQSVKITARCHNILPTRSDGKKWCSRSPVDCRQNAAQIGDETAEVCLKATTVGENRRNPLPPIL